MTINKIPQIHNLYFSWNIKRFKKCISSLDEYYNCLIYCITKDRYDINNMVEKVSNFISKPLDKFHFVIQLE